MVMANRSSTVYMLNDFFLGVIKSRCVYATLTEAQGMLWLVKGVPACVIFTEGIGVKAVAKTSWIQLPLSESTTRPT